MRELLDDARRLFEALGRVKSRAAWLAHGQGVGPCRRGVEQLAGRGLGPGSGPRETVDLQRWDDPVDQALDRRERLALIGADEQVGDAVLAHASGPADPVDVVLRIVGHVVVDDVADALDIDAAADDVGGDQHRDLPASEPAASRGREWSGARSPWMAETPLITLCSRSARRSAPRLVRVKTMHCRGRSRLSKSSSRSNF